MGCFNVYCAVTRAPIRVNNKCVMITLDKSHNHYHYVDSFDPLYWIGEFLLDISVGKYNDYGNIDGEKYKDISAYHHIFIKNNIWNYFKKREKECISANRIISSAKLADEMQKLATKNSILNDYPTQFCSNYKTILKFEKEIALIQEIYYFCYVNGYNIFSTHFTSYCAPQMPYTKTLLEWNQLRLKEIEKLPKNI